VRVVEAREAHPGCDATEPEPGPAAVSPLKEIPREEGGGEGHGGLHELIHGRVEEEEAAVVEPDVGRGEGPEHGLRVRGRLGRQVTEGHPLETQHAIEVAGHMGQGVYGDHVDRGHGDGEPHGGPQEQPPVDEAEGRPTDAVQETDDDVEAAQRHAGMEERGSSKKTDGNCVRYPSHWSAFAPCGRRIVVERLLKVILNPNEALLQRH